MSEYIDLILFPNTKIGMTAVYNVHLNNSRLVIFKPPKRHAYYYQNKRKCNRKKDR